MISRVPWWAWAAAVPIALVALLVVAWLADDIRRDGLVARNTDVAGEDVSGLDEASLDAHLDAVAARFARTPIRIEAPERTITLSAAELGARVDTSATAHEVFDTGSSGFLPFRPFTWLLGLGDERDVPLEFAIDIDRARDTLEAADLVEVPPIEPSLIGTSAGFELVEGVPGTGVDVDGVLDALPGAVARGGDTIVVEVGLTDVAPRYDRSSFDPVVASAEALTGRPVEVQINDFTATLAPEMMGTWLAAEVGENGPELVIDYETADTDLTELLADGATGGGDAVFTVEDGEVRIVPSDAGTVCCAVGAAEVVLENIREDAEQPFLLPGRPQTEAEGRAAIEELGIVEEVSTFTTNHQCCEGRVTNIQRFADLVRGAVILPDETFSLNDHVGRRTRENGFVDGGAIQRGVFVSDVGGGVSQFATTFFNAAFFAGMDFVDYQAHSIKIGRYPAGREATINWPDVDLVVENTTGYGILVWTSYTDTSITVTMYSTKHIEVPEVEPEVTSQGVCQRYTTPRERRYADGRVVEDEVFAVYRPAEGINCDGSSSVPTVPAPPAPPPTTTTAPVPTTVAPTTAAPPPATTAAPPPATTAAPPPATTAAPAPPPPATTASTPPAGG